MIDYHDVRVVWDRNTNSLRLHVRPLFASQCGASLDVTYENLPREHLWDNGVNLVHLKEVRSRPAGQILPNCIRLCPAEPTNVVHAVNALWHRIPYTGLLSWNVRYTMAGFGTSPWTHLNHTPGTFQSFLDNWTGGEQVFLVLAYERRQTFSNFVHCCFEIDLFQPGAFESNEAMVEAIAGLDLRVCSPESLNFSEGGPSTEGEIAFVFLQFISTNRVYLSYLVLDETTGDVLAEGGVFYSGANIFPTGSQTWTREGDPATPWGSWAETIDVEGGCAADPAPAFVLAVVRGRGSIDWPCLSAEYTDGETIYSEEDFVSLWNSELNFACEVLQVGGGGAHNEFFMLRDPGTVSFDSNTTAAIDETFGNAAVQDEFDSIAGAGNLIVHRPAWFTFPDYDGGTPPPVATYNMTLLIGGFTGDLSNLNVANPTGSTVLHLINGGPLP